MYSPQSRGAKVEKVEQEKENPTLAEYSHLNVNAQIPIPPLNLPKPIQNSPNGNEH